MSPMTCDPYTDGIDPYPTPALFRWRNWMFITDTDQITGNGTSDDTTGTERALEKACDSGKELLVPNNIDIRLTEPIANPGKKGLKIRGGGTEIHKGSNYNAGGCGERGPGSWFFLDHYGKGFDFTGRDNGSGLVGNSHFSIHGIATYRPQPAPSANWVPGNFEHDLYFTQCTADIDDLTMLNPTRGLSWRRARAGQLNIGKIRGQPLLTGITIVNAYDVVRVADVHFWPYWSLDSNVMKYLRLNADAIVFGRCDGPMFGNTFTFGYSRTILFSSFFGNGDEEPGGSVYHGSFDNVYADMGGQAFAIGAESDGCTIDVKRIIAEQTTAITTNTPNVYIAGQNAKVSIGHLSGNNARSSVVANVGVQSKVLISRFEPRIFNRGGAGFAALQASAYGAEIDVGQTMNVWTSNGAPLAYESDGGRVTGLVKRGTAVIPSGSAGVTVAHGLGVKPKGARFDLLGVTPQANGTYKNRSPVFDINNVSFDIGTLATSNIPISWEVFF